MKGESVGEKASKMVVKFRVVARVNVILLEADVYETCDRYCWKYEGPDELHIEKVWVPISDVKR